MNNELNHLELLTELFENSFGYMGGGGPRHELRKIKLSEWYRNHVVAYLQGVHIDARDVLPHRPLDITHTEWIAAAVAWHNNHTGVLVSN